MIQSKSPRAIACPRRRVAGCPARFAAVLALLAALSACAPAPIRPSGAAGDAAAQARREQVLAAQPDWSFSGRVAVSQAGDGGSARIDWTQHGDDYEIRLAAPVTRQGWRLSRKGGLARLEGLDGGPREGPDAEALLLEATGWRLPVERLAAWVRGARAPGPATLSSDPLGRPALIQQDGWTVEYREWDAADPARPLRVFADRDTARVRLVVERWSTP
jgi:outer membrane lipoprotein LolB